MTDQVSDPVLYSSEKEVDLIYCKRRCKIAVVSNSRFILGRLPKVDLIILEGENVRPSVRTSVRPSVRPQKVSSISMKFGI